MFLISICFSVLLILPEGKCTSTNSSIQIASRLNPSNSFLTTFNYDISTCSCSGTDNLRSNGIWVTWNNQKGSRPDNSVYAGYSSSGSQYVMRVQFNNNGLIVGKYVPEVKSAWIPYGGYEHGGFTTFEVRLYFRYSQEIIKYF